MTLDAYKPSFDKIVEHLKEKLASLRTDRAHPAMVENIQVTAYGQATPIKSLASITIPDARTIVVQPWDKGIVKDIEKAVRDAGTGLNPVAQGEVIRIPIPPMTEESRREAAKLVSQYAEESRIAARRLRDEVKEKIITAEAKKEIREDERFRLQDKLDETVKGINEKIKEMSEKKEREVVAI